MMVQKGDKMNENIEIILLTTVFWLSVILDIKKIKYDFKESLDEIERELARLNRKK